MNVIEYDPGKCPEPLPRSDWFDYFDLWPHIQQCDTCYEHYYEADVIWTEEGGTVCRGCHLEAAARQSN